MATNHAFSMIFISLVILVPGVFLRFGELIRISNINRFHVSIGAGFLPFVHVFFYSLGYENYLSGTHINLFRFLNSERHIYQDIQSCYGLQLSRRFRLLKCMILRWNQPEFIFREYHGNYIPIIE